MMKKNNVLCFFLVFGIFLLITIVFFFLSGRFFPFEKIDGVDVSCLDRTSRYSKVLNDIKHRPVLLKGYNGYEESFYYDDIEVSGLRNSIYTLRPKYPFFNHSVNYSLKYDVDSLKKSISNLYCVSEKALESKDSSVVFEDGTYVFKDSFYGEKVDYDKLCDLIMKSFGKTNVVYLYDIYEYTYDDVVVKKDITNSTMFIDMGYGVYEKVPSEIIKKSVYKKDDVYYINYILRSYIDILSNRYANDSGYLFKTHDGRDLFIRPSENDTYEGWVLDSDMTFKNMIDAFNKGDTRIDAVWLYKGFSHKKGSIGSEYIEVDLKTQQLFYFKGGKEVFHSDIVSGNPNGYETPCGIFRIFSRDKNYTMSGEYGNAHCNYFIRLNERGIGIHDAVWQKKFGGTEYQKNGSHGCINMPLAKMKMIFNLIKDKNIPVIIHK